jgi:hypothetical protein
MLLQHLNEISVMLQALSPSAITPLRSIFEDHSELPWLFVRPGGNWGDRLIYAGAEKLAADVGLAWSTCSAETFPDTPVSSEHCIYLHGGGGYNTWCSGRVFSNLAHAVRQDVPLVVQGPQSTQAEPGGLIERMNTALDDARCGEIIFFARETVSLNALSLLDVENLRIRLALDHDTALHLQIDDLCRLAELPALPKGRYHLNISRQDNEKPRSSGSKSNSPRGVTLDPAFVAQSFVHWLRIHLYARSITTNRLHSAIVGSIAGKPVTLGPGSYHKNHSVWEFSLAQRNSKWSEHVHLSSDNESCWLPRVICESYKVRWLWLAAHGVPMRP